MTLGIIFIIGSIILAGCIIYLALNKPKQKQG